MVCVCVLLDIVDLVGLVGFLEFLVGSGVGA